ncbi:AraC family transcriptional regulator [Salegentibacter sp. 24]|uniref:AraC family transcriptional regulator n=1 Tax=Salegentibacter sp. 24 TaxID=2183986 RepID=UPI00105D1E20|nr:AraC family transcriptional regulator [Salegentibacter sp. 24]
MIKSSKPSFEKVDPSFGSSFSFKSFNQKHQNKNHTFWHYHPEIELVYVNDGSGKRQIGSHVSYYQHGDLILIGANLPHCGFTDSLTDHDKETVIQFSADFLGKNFWEIPEMKNVRVLLERAKNGIVFHGEDKEIIGRKIEALNSLTNYKRLLGLLEVLNMLENAKDFTLLNAEGFVLDTALGDNNRINVIFNFVKNEFKRNIALEEIADLVSMTVPAFCRYFKKTTGKTFIQFVNEYRLVHAAKLLHEKQISINDVCFESGFNNFSHFNKQFKKFTGKSPSIYRNEIKFSVS